MSENKILIVKITKKSSLPRLAKLMTNYKSNALAADQYSARVGSAKLEFGIVTNISSAANPTLISCHILSSQSGLEPFINVLSYHDSTSLSKVANEASFKAVN